MLPAKQIKILIPELTYAELVVMRDLMMSRMFEMQNKIKDDLQRTA